MGVVRFISDTHLHHKNIMRMDRRPWDDVRAMDDDLIANWNRVVRDDDITYHLGDVALGITPLARLVELRGQIRIIPGNHDETLVSLRATLASATGGRILVLDPIVEVRGVASSTLILCHYAMETWHHSHKTVHLHGHTHPAFDDAGRCDPSPGLASHPRRFNVCMGGLFHGEPARRWRPLTFQEITEQVRKQADRRVAAGQLELSEQHEGMK